MAVVGGDDDGGVGEHLVDAAAGLERLAEHAVDPFERGQRVKGPDSWLR